MGCRGDSCEAEGSMARVKQVTAEQRARVDLWLRDFYDQAVREKRYDLAERIVKEELKEKKKK